MAEELFVEEGVCSVRWDAEIESLVLEWYGDVSGEVYYDVMERVLDLIADRDANKLLADSQQQGLMSEADQDWTAEDWQPRAVDAGLAYKAVVYPEDRPAKTTVDMSARKRPRPGLERLFTDDLEEARNWLRAK